MKKVLLSLAVTAMAIPAFAQGSLNDILGTYQANYDLYWNNSGHPVVVDNVTITQIEGNNVEISTNMLQFDGRDMLAKPVPAVYNPEAGTLFIKGSDLVFSGFSCRIEFENSQVEDLELWLDEDGTFFFADYENDFDLWFNYPGYAVYEYYLNPVEVGVGGGEEPGDDDAFEVTLSPSTVTAYRIEAGKTFSDKTECNPVTTGAYAVVESITDPMVTMTIVNIGSTSSSQSYMNNMAAEGTDLKLYGGNGDSLIPEFVISVEDGYVITKITATLYSLEGNNITWTFDGTERFTSSTSGTKVVYNCNSDIVRLTNNWTTVKATKFANFVITVTKDETTAVKGIESENANAPVIFYDLQGRKVSNPSNGIFIRQQGNKINKVVVK